MEGQSEREQHSLQLGGSFWKTRAFGAGVGMEWSGTGSPWS